MLGKSSRRKERIAAAAVTLAFLLVFCAATFPTAASAAPQTDSWVKLAHMNVGRFGFGAASVGGKIYAISGGIFMGPMLNTNEVYDTATNSWTTKKPIPTGREGFGIAAVGSRIYCIGGYRERPMATMEIYDTLTDTWMTGAPMPKAREYVSANVVNGKIYAIGGKYTLYSPSDENQMYDPQTGEWTSKASIPKPPSQHVSAVIGSKIYIISDNLTQIYDAETDTWSTGAPIQVVGGTAVAAATTGTYAPKRIYVIDGTANWVFDPQTNSWSTAASPQEPALFAGIAVVNDQIYRIGGTSPSYAQLDECHRYTPTGYHQTLVTPLSVSILSPSNDQSGLHGDVDLVFAVNRKTVDVASASYRLDGQAAVAVPGNVTISGLSAGTHSLSVEVTDALQNTVTSQTITFTVEPFPTVWVSAAIIASTAVVSFGLVAYLLRRKRRIGEA